MRENRVKKMLKEGKTVVGFGLGITANPNVVRVLAGTGYDFLFIDAEHNLLPPDTLMAVVQMARACDISPLVRIQDTEYHLVANTLDSGAEGVIVPRVEGKAQAERIVAYSKFPPMGVRGCGTIATLDFNREQDWGQSIAWLNEQTLVVAQVESLPAVETLDDTLRVTGIDAIVVGPLDLSISLGVPGQFSHPRMIETIDRVIATCRAHRVPSGIVMGTPQDLKPWWDKGMRFLVCGNDLTVLQSTARAYVNTVRAYVGSE